METMRNVLAQLADQIRPAQPPGTEIAARSPVPISSTTAWHRPVGSGIWARSDLLQQMELMGRSGIVHAIVRRRASDVAKIPWGLYRNPMGRSKLEMDDERTEVPDHQALRIWRSPNPWFTPTRRAFLQLQHTYLELCGEAITLVNTIGSGPSAIPWELWPARPDRVMPVPDPYDGLAGWEYTSPDGVVVPLRRDQVIQVKYANPLDPWRGLSPIVAAMIDIDAGIMSSEWYRNFYANSARPGGIVSTKVPMTTGQWNEWVRRWNEQHGGVENAFRVSLMDSDTTWISAQMNMVDAQFVQLVADNREKVREALGMSKVMLGLSEDVNRATSEAARSIYAENSLEDAVDLWREALNGPLFLGRFMSGRAAGRGVAPPVLFDIATDLKPADVETEAKDRDSRVGLFSALTSAGGDPTEAMELAGFDPITFTEPEPEPVPAQLHPPGGDTEVADGDDPGIDNDPTEGGEGGSPPATAARWRPPPTRASWATVLAEVDLAEIGGDPDEPLDHLQDSWATALDALMADYADLNAAMKAEILDQLPRLLADRGLDGLADLTVDTTPVAARLHQAMISVAAEAADSIREQAADANVRLDDAAGADPASLRRAADQVAEMLGRRLIGTVKSTALRSWSAENDDT